MAHSVIPLKGTPIVDTLAGPHLSTYFRNMQRRQHHYILGLPSQEALHSDILSCSSHHSCRGHATTTSNYSLGL